MKPESHGFFQAKQRTNGIPDRVEHGSSRHRQQLSCSAEREGGYDYTVCEREEKGGCGILDQRISYGPLRGGMECYLLRKRYPGKRSFR
ncbi:MAG TPA: hypothetical protein PKJ23_01200 [bacterium]|nr:hypothetical protein [bacterium]